MIENVMMEDSTCMPMPERFETGSQPIAQIVGWIAVLGYPSKLGMDRICAQEEQLTARLLEQTRDPEGVWVLGPSSALKRVDVIAFVVEGMYPYDVGQVLDADDVAVHVGHHCVTPLHSFFGVRSSARVPVVPMTSPEEIDRFIAPLGRVRSFFKRH